MAIDRVQTFVLVHQMSRGRGPSIANYTTRESVLLKISDSSGAVGWGETYASSGIVAILTAVGEMLIGRDPLRSGEIHAITWNATASPEATSVVAIAIDDLRGKILGMPAHGLYGGALRSRVRAYASSGGYFDGVDPKDSWPQEIAELTGMGFTAIKMRVGRYPIRHELSIIERLRSDYPDLDFMADGNAAYTLPRALEMGRGLAGFGFKWFEEPIPQSIGGGDEYAGYERMREALDLPLAGGEGGDFKVIATRDPAVRSSATTGATTRCCSCTISTRSRARSRSAVGLPGETGELLVNLLTEDHSHADKRGQHTLLLEAYGYRWYRVGGLDYLLKRSDIDTDAHRGEGRSHPGA